MLIHLHLLNIAADDDEGDDPVRERCNFHDICENEAVQPLGPHSNSVHPAGANHLKDQVDEGLEEEKVLEVEPHVAVPNGRVFIRLGEKK